MDVLTSIPPLRCRATLAHGGQCRWRVHSRTTGDRAGGRGAFSLGSVVIVIMSVCRCGALGRATPAWWAGGRWRETPPPSGGGWSGRTTVVSWRWLRCPAQYSLSRASNHLADPLTHDPPVQRFSRGVRHPGLRHLQPGLSPAPGQSARLDGLAQEWAHAEQVGNYNIGTLANCCVASVPWCSPPPASGRRSGPRS